MICTPVRPRNKGRIQTSGTKKIPCLAMARNVAGTVWPMVWSIMLLIVTQTWQVLHLPPTAIQPNPWQPRRFFDSEELESLADSIRRHGILQPLTVRRNGEGWELVAGERRLRAAQMAGLETVPCVEREADD